MCKCTFSYIKLLYLWPYVNLTHERALDNFASCQDGVAFFLPDPFHNWALDTAGKEYPQCHRQRCRNQAEGTQPSSNLLLPEGVQWQTQVSKPTGQEICFHPNTGGDISLVKHSLQFWQDWLILKGMKEEGVIEPNPRNVWHPGVGQSG